MKKTSGRNNYGRITVRHHGGGNRTKYRVIDFKRDKVGMNATVQTIEYDPNRSAFIALIQFEDGEKRYILAPDGLKVGHIIRNGADADIKPATLCLWQTSRLVPLSTASSCTTVRALSWSVQLATWLS